MATHSWIIPWTEEPGYYSPQSGKESYMSEGTEHAVRNECCQQCGAQAAHKASNTTFNKRQYIQCAMCSQASQLLRTDQELSYLVLKC